jgi:hypothetical protein
MAPGITPDASSPTRLRRAPEGPESGTCCGQLIGAVDGGKSDRTGNSTVVRTIVVGLVALCRLQPPMLGLKTAISRMLCTVCR